MSVSSMPDLRPLSMGQLFDRAIRLYRQNFLKFVGIVAVTQIPATLFGLAIGLLTASRGAFISTNDLLTPIFGVAFIVGIVAFVLTQISTAAMTWAVADNYLGKSVAIWDSYRKIGQSWLSLIGALLLVGILMMALGIVMAIPFIGWLLAIVQLGGIFVYIIAVIAPLIAPIIVLEQQRASKSIYRAWGLSRQRFWWVLGFTVLLWLFANIIVTGPTFLSAFLLQTTLSVGPETSTIIQQVVQLLFALIYRPLQLTCITLLYFDLRVRTEGFDLAILAASGDVVDSSVDVVSQVPEPPSKFGFTSTELLYFFLISGGGFAVLVGLGFIMALGVMTLPGLGGA